MAAAGEIYAGLRRLSAAATAAGSTPPFRFADYLVQSCGLSESKAKAAAAAAASSAAARISSPSNPDAVLRFLRSRGLSGGDIAALVARNPVLLAADVDANLVPKVDLLETLGLTPPEAAKLVVTARLWQLKIDTAMKRRLDFVRSIVGGVDGDVVKVIRRSSWVVGSPNIQRRVAHNLSKLGDWGIHGEKARSLFVCYPRYFNLHPASIDAAAARAETEFGVPRHGTMFFYLVFALLSQSESSFQSKFAVFEGFGWERSEAVALLKSFPMCFCQSEGKLRKGLDFLMNRVGYTPSEIIGKPALLGMSLEKRLLPRYELISVLKSKNLIRSTLSFRQAAYLTEKEFVEKYVTKFMQQEVDACEAYLSGLGSANKK